VVESSVEDKTLDGPGCIGCTIATCRAGTARLPVESFVEVTGVPESELLLKADNELSL